MYALNLDNDGRVLSVTFPQYAPTDAVIVDALPEGDISDYRYVDGEFLFQPVPAVRDIAAEIAALKAQLTATDYAIIKIAEGAATREEYADVIIQRQEWRRQINELEAEM